MRRFRFLHTADLHMGSPFQGLQSRLPDLWSARVRQAADEVFRRIVDIAIEERVDFVTIAGDVFDAPSVPMHVWFELQRGMQKLCDAGIRVFLSHGNHDPLTGPTPVAWPENVYVFPAVSVEPTEALAPAWLELAPDTRIQICGFSYSRAAMTASCANAFVRHRDADFAIGLYHGSVGAVASADHATYCPTSVQELSTRGFDVFALGHIHQQVVLSQTRPLVFYPGVPQGRHIREPGVHGVAIVEVDEQGRTAVTWRRTAAVTFAPVEVSLDEEDSLSLVPKRVAAVVRSVSSGGPASQVQQIQAKDSDLLPTIVRLYLTGVTPLASALQPSEDLHSTLMGELQVLGLPAWIEDIRSELVPPLDRAALMHSAEFVGELLRLVEECRSDLELARTLLAPVLEAVFHDGGDLTLVEPGENEWRFVLDAAERQVLTWYAAAGSAEGANR
ncbi:metallophosphoesterase family protein [Alicyclobacillus sp. ALC3]|uniref:metallophosphoesterase family protein n=1 Tax=Alicyclobacillus sp. ALC3 TaxID=2796143 RepID=UPI002378D015|nr:DNA repair exonuclease [Alicyclobacillus sp. ALC3]WDL96213.1 DNA repair exonuclease [Alicyclobacillus sp. ALC3]